MRPVALALYAVWLVAYAGTLKGRLPDAGGEILRRFLGGFGGPGTGLFHAAAVPLAMLAAAAVILAAAAATGAVAGAMRRAGGGAPAVAPLLGVAIFSFAVQSLGFCGLLFRPVLAVLALCPFMALASRRGREAAASLAEPFVGRGGEVLPAALLALALLVAAFGACLPFYVTDVSSYHLGAPEEYLREHRWFAHPEEWAWHMGLAGEHFALPAYALGGLAAAKAVFLSFGLLLVAAAYALGRDLAGSREGGRWAAAFTASCGMVPLTALYGKTDLLSMAAAGVAGALVLAARGPGGWLVAGAAGAFAFSAKLSAGFVLAGVAVGALVAGGGIRRLGPLVAGAAAASVPLLAGNWLSVGSPLFPFDGGLFRAPAWTPALGEAVHGAWRTLTGTTDLTPKAFLTNPFGFGLPEFGSVALGLLLPAGLLLRGAGLPAAGRLAAMLGAAYIGLLAVNQYPRYLACLIPLVAAFCARPFALPFLASRARALGAAAVVANLVLVVPLLLKPLPAEYGGWLAGKVDASAALAAYSPPREDARKWLAGNLGPRDRLLVGAQQRYLGLGTRQFASTFWGPSPQWRWVAESGTPARLAVKFRQAGVTHLAHNMMVARRSAVTWYSGGEWTGRALGAWAVFCRDYMEPVMFPGRTDYEGGAPYVFRIRKAPVRIRGALLALPGTEGAFEQFHRRLTLADPATAGDRVVEARALADRLGGNLDAGDWLAMALMDAGRYRDALKVFEAERRAGYVNSTNYLVHARCLVRLGRRPEARKVLEWYRSRYGDPAIAREEANAR